MTDGNRHLEGTVIVPSKDRPPLLRKTIGSLKRQETEREFEVLVVDDGSEPPLVPADVGSYRLARRTGPGSPSAARNVGIAAARGDVLLFTDNDVEVSAGWVEAALAFLAAHPDHVGVCGPIRTTPYDPLAGYSIEVESLGRYYTANLALRRSVIDKVGGFDETIRAHGEDLDLAFRAERLGPIGWEPRMEVLHHAREMPLTRVASRSRLAPNDVIIFRRYRERFGRAARLPAFLFPYSAILYGWLDIARREGWRVFLRPARLIRLIVLLLLQFFFATRALVGMGLGRWREAGPPPP
jgi:GT2 family glycosyltransferase